MTKAQRVWIEKIGEKGSVKVWEIPQPTREALIGQGMIEYVPRPQRIGERRDRVQLTPTGKHERQSQKL